MPKHWRQFYEVMANAVHDTATAAHYQTRRRSRDVRESCRLAILGSGSLRRRDGLPCLETGRWVRHVVLSLLHWWVSSSQHRVRQLPGGNASCRRTESPRLSVHSLVFWIKDIIQVYLKHNLPVLETPEFASVWEGVLWQSSRSIKAVVNAEVLKRRKQDARRCQLTWH